MYKLHSPPNKSRSTAFSEKNICIPNSLYLGLQLRDEYVPDSGDGGNKDVPEEDVVEEEAAKPENDTNQENEEDKDLKPDRNSKVRLPSLCECEEDIPDYMKAGDEGRLVVEEVEGPEKIETEDNIENKIYNNEPTIPSSRMKEKPDLAGGSSRQEVIHQISRPVHPSSRQEVIHQLTRLVPPSSLKEENHQQARPVPFQPAGT